MKSEKIKLGKKFSKIYNTTLINMSRKNKLLKIMGEPIKIEPKNVFNAFDNLETQNTFDFNQELFAKTLIRLHNDEDVIFFLMWMCDSLNLNDDYSDSNNKIMNFLGLKLLDKYRQKIFDNSK